MTCNCKCCCGCCCDGETGSQTLEPACEAPKVYHGKGTSCDVCCDLGEIREDIDSEEACPGTWVIDGRCKGCCPPERVCGEVCCPEGQACVDGECVTQCPSECGAEGDCGEQCECCTSWDYASPGSLVAGCRPVSEGYACCCASYKKLCYVDKTEIRPAEGFPPPDIAGDPPANAIVLINSSALYTDVNREIEGSYDIYEGLAQYNYGYYFVCDDGDGAEDWFGGPFDPSYWQLFCDAATLNEVDVCAENPLP